VLALILDLNQGWLIPPAHTEDSRELASKKHLHFCSQIRKEMDKTEARLNSSHIKEMASLREQVINMA